MGTRKTGLAVLITVIASFILLAAAAVLPKRLIFGGADGYTFFIGEGSKNCTVITAGSDAALLRLTLSGVCGESATYKSLDAHGFIKSVGGEIKFTEELCDSVNYYCTAPLPYSVTLYGEEINLHVCVKSDGVTVASPIIFGGY